MIQNFFRASFSVLLSLLLCGAFSFVLASVFASLYETVTDSSLSSSFLDFTEVIGFLFAFLFATAFFGGFHFGATRYVMIAISAVIAVFVVTLDLQAFYIPIVVVLVGAGLGWGIKRVYTSLKK